MSYKIQKKCKPCIICNNTGWELITDCRCDKDDVFQRKNMKSLFKYWAEFYGEETELRLIKE